MTLALWDWLVATLRAHPELAVFLALALGFAVGPLKVMGFTLGNVTATLLAGVLIGQLGIAIAGPIKSTFFLMFLFAVGFGVGPQFFRGLGKEGPRQIVFSLVVLVLCLAVPVLCAIAAGLDLGYAAGLYAGIADHFGGDRRRDGSDRSAGIQRRAGAKPIPTRSRSATPSPTSSARSARPSFWHSSARS